LPLKSLFLVLVGYGGVIDSPPVVAMTPNEFSGLVLRYAVRFDDMLDLGILTLERTTAGLAGRAVTATRSHFRHG